MPGWVILGAVLTLLVLMTGMWLAFNLNDYGLNDWEEEEEESKVTEERGEGERRMRAREVGRMGAREVGRAAWIDMRRLAGREVYCISRPSDSVDSAISLTSPNDSTGKCHNVIF